MEQVQSKVVKVAELQAVFTEKVFNLTYPCNYCWNQNAKCSSILPPLDMHTPWKIELPFWNFSENSSAFQVLEQADILDVVHAQAVNTTENTKVLLALLGKDCRVTSIFRLRPFWQLYPRRETKQSGKQFKTRPATGFTFSSSCSSSLSGKNSVLIIFN